MPAYYTGVSAELMYVAFHICACILHWHICRTYVYIHPYLCLHATLAYLLNTCMYPSISVPAWYTGISAEHMYISIQICACMLHWHICWTYVCIHPYLCLHATLTYLLNKCMYPSISVPAWYTGISAEHMYISIQICACMLHWHICWTYVCIHPYLCLHATLTYLLNKCMYPSISMPAWYTSIFAELIIYPSILVPTCYIIVRCAGLIWSDLFDRNKILSGGDLSHYQVPHCIRVFFYFVWFVFITIFNFILNYVPIVTFWIFTYHKIWIFTRGQFWPSGIVVACVCPSVRQSVHHQVCPHINSLPVQARNTKFGP